MAEQDTLLTFPCEFPIKIMGRAADDFEELVITIARRHIGEVGEGAMRTRPSRDGTYVSVTLTVVATSQEQLDGLYRELTAHERVLMAL